MESFGGSDLLREAVEILRTLSVKANHVEPRMNWLPADPADNWVIECALSVAADRIVTGDKLLLGLNAVEGLKIVTVRDLLTELGIVVP